MAKRDMMGRIDCPYCGYKDGMKITEDKSGNPFGYCDAQCAGQISVRSDEQRKKLFFAKYPHLKRTDAPPVEKPAQRVAPVAPSKKDATDTAPKNKNINTWSPLIGGA